jgi:hypothetical protein
MIVTINMGDFYIKLEGTPEEILTVLNREETEEEPKDNIDWSTIPTRYNYITNDYFNEVYAHENKPTLHPDFKIWAQDGMTIPLPTVKIGGDWEDSLRERPE